MAGAVRKLATLSNYAFGSLVSVLAQTIAYSLHSEIVTLSIVNSAVSYSSTDGRDHKVTLTLQLELLLPFFYSSELFNDGNARKRGLV